MVLSFLGLAGKGSVSTALSSSVRLLAASVGLERTPAIFSSTIIGEAERLVFLSDLVGDGVAMADLTDGCATFSVTSCGVMRRKETASKWLMPFMLRPFTWEGHINND